MNAPATQRYKTFSFEVGLQWNEGRIGAMTARGKPSVEVASPPEFKGVPGKWSPEDLFLSAVNACQMTTFLGLVLRMGLPLTSYTCTAKGTVEFIDGGYKFTKIILTPEIQMKEGTDLNAVRELVEKAHTQCLVARSTNCPVEVNPTINAG